ncbi:ABC transporter ATP-binding protein, partial [candidate division KSB1 bacterium]|nr:ABC transporter ATP-binding protein [candidate division KSB1 bacterium]
MKKIHLRLPALRQAAELVYKSSAKWTVASTALALVQGLFPLLSIYLMKLIVDAVTAGIAAADKDAAFRQVFILILLAGIVGVVGFLVNALSQIVQEYRDLRVAEYIYKLIHKKSVQVDLEFYENPHYFNTLHLAQHQAMYRPVQMVNKLVQVVQNSITLGAMVAVLMTFDALLIFFVGVAVIPAIWVKFKFSKRVYRWHQKWAGADRRAQYYSWLITSQQYAKDLRLYQLGELFIARFRNLHWQVVMDRLKLNRKRATADLFGQVFTMLVVFALLMFMAQRAVAGVITIGGLVMYYQAFQRGQSALQISLKGMADLYEDSLFLNSLFEFLNLQPKIVDPPKPRTLPRHLKKGIEFTHVTFCYPESTRMALQDISFSIGPGEHIALVGENGSGKSTLVKLLCRLYDPKKGSIFADGIDLRELAVDKWRGTLGVLFQDFSKYHTSARENIWLGNIRIDERDERIIEAAR